MTAPDRRVLRCLVVELRIKETSEGLIRDHLFDRQTPEINPRRRCRPSHHARLPEVPDGHRRHPRSDRGPARLLNDEITIVDFDPGGRYKGYDDMRNGRYGIPLERT